MKSRTGGSIYSEPLISTEPSRNVPHYDEPSWRTMSATSPTRYFEVELQGGTCMGPEGNDSSGVACLVMNSLGSLVYARNKGYLELHDRALDLWVAECLCISRLNILLKTIWIWLSPMVLISAQSVKAGERTHTDQIYRSTIQQHEVNLGQSRGKLYSKEAHTLFGREREDHRLL
jgi:hypothetical protein